MIKTNAGLWLLLCCLISSTLVYGQKIEHKAHEFSTKSSYQNPVIRGFYPDPSICRVGDDYYLVTSTFGFFPAVPVFHSKDLVNWEQIGYALSRKSQLNLDSVGVSGGVWAPTIRYHDGLFYMITTCMPHGLNFFVTAKDPAGPWSEPTFVPVRCIDPSLLFDDDGKVYFTGTSPWVEDSEHGIHQAEIDIETGKLLSDYRPIWKGTGGSYPEGPHLYKIDGWYYLLIAEGGTEAGHMVTIARSKQPFGPFEPCPHNPILTSRNIKPANPQNTGHGDLVQAPDGRWWMVHLGVRSANKYHHLGRETCLAPVNWDDKGWPVVNRTGTVSIKMYPKTDATQKAHQAYGRFEFDNEELGLAWNYLRNPISDNYSLSERPGSLCLTASSEPLEGMMSPTFVGIRQRDFDIDARTQMTFSPTEDGQEAGLLAFMNEQAYYAVSVVHDNGENYVQGIMKFGMVTHISSKMPLYSFSTVLLRLTADQDTYRLYYSTDNEIWVMLGSNSCKYLSSEVAGGFTGVYLGLYAITGNKPVKAYFDYFDYITKKQP